jgi:hypothetical protein
VIDTSARVRARRGVADAALDEAEIPPIGRRDASFDECEVLACAGGEIIEHRDALAEFQQGLDEMRANESRASGNKPRSWV